LLKFILTNICGHFECFFGKNYLYCAWLGARIGTQDWSDTPERKKEVDELIKDCLDKKDFDYGPIWVDNSHIEAATSKGCVLKDLSKKEILRVLAEHEPPSTKSQAIDQVVKVVNDVIPNISEDDMSRIKKRLENNPLFSKVIRKRGKESESYY